MTDVHTPRPAGHSFVSFGADNTSRVDSMVWVAGCAEAASSPEPGSWLLDRLLPWGTTAGTRVGAIIPAGYEAYARILHPAWSLPNGRMVPISWRDVAAWSGRIVHPEVQWEAVIRPSGITSNPKPWDQDPAIGFAPDVVRKSICESLKLFSKEHSCWTAIWEGWGCLGGAFPEIPVLQLPGRNYLLLSASWECVESSVFGGVAERDVSPSLWWPSDRSWCVATEIDFRWTYVAGSRQCIERILADDRLEALPTIPAHRADYMSDILNGPVAP